MSILDKAQEQVQAWAFDSAGTDEYGNLNYFPDPDTYVIFKAFILPVGFSGAGWAINSKLEAQGDVDIQRNRIIYKPTTATAFISRYTKVRMRNGLWSVQEAPKVIIGTRPSQSVTLLTVEYEGVWTGSP